MSDEESIKIKIEVAVLRLCIEALEYKAHSEAGHSQEPNLFSADETTEWDAARYLRLRIARLRGRRDERV